MKNIRAALFKLVLANLMIFVAFHSARATEPAMPLTWEGTINNAIPVSLWFDVRGGLVMGEITYTKTGTNSPIRLLGYATGPADDPELLLHEFLPSGQITGIIKGKISNTTFTGTWQAPDRISEKNGQYQTSEAILYPLALTSQSPVWPESLWQFDPSAMAGTYEFSYGENAASGSVKLALTKDGFVDFSIDTNSAAPGFNMCRIPVDAYDGNYEHGRLEGNRIVHEIDEDCALELILYSEFLFVRTLDQRHCSGYCGMGAYIEGTYLKTQAASQNSGPTTGAETRFVPLRVQKDQVRLRSLPGLDSETKKLADLNTILLAEMPVVQEQDSGTGWYKIVGILDHKTGTISSRLALGQFTPAYISSTMVQEISFSDAKLTESQILAELAQTPYGQGYSAIDISQEEQRNMASKNTLPASVFFHESSQTGPIPIYKTPSTAGELTNSQVTWEDLQENYLAFDLLALDSKDEDWIFVVDQNCFLPAGWVETKLVDVTFFDDGRRIGQLIPLHLGAHVSEMMKRWGPGELQSRTVHEYWRGPQEQTVLRFDGLEVEYEDCRNVTFTLTRQGAGLGGIFINTPWCNQDYIEKIFGPKVSIEKSTQDGEISWNVGCYLDGWGYQVLLFFNAQGLVQKFSFSGHDNNLS